MPTSTNNNKKNQTEAVPLEGQMWEREGFDRKGLRRELAGYDAISLDTKYKEQEDQTFVDPRTLDMPVGPTGMGEAGGTGVEMFRVDGDRWPTHRWTQGFQVLKEDNSDVASQRNAVGEMFDFFADASFYTGLGPNGEYADGWVDWLKTAIPTERSFDAENYDGDSGDKDYTGVEENLIKYDAYSEISGRILNNGNDANWDVMIGSQKALAQFNKISGSNGGVSGDSYWDRLSTDQAFGGVERQILIPDEIQPARVPINDPDLSADAFSVDLVDTGDGNGVIGENEVFLLPDMEQVGQKYWQTYEMGEPEYFGPLEQRMGKVAHDYAWRYTHKFNPKRRFADAPDAVHITNVDKLFN